MAYGFVSNSDVDVEAEAEGSSSATDPRGLKLLSDEKRTSADVKQEGRLSSEMLRGITCLLLATLTPNCLGYYLISLNLISIHSVFIL